MHQLENAIASQQTLYNTTEPYYLSNFYQPNGNKHLYDFLTSVYQSEYKHNFRILIVQDCADTYDYADLPGRAICALQKHVSQIDISNFFILIITSNNNISVELEQVQKLYSTDSCSMQSHIVEEIEYSAGVATRKIQDTFCVLPWMHLYVGTDGNVLPCCVADHQHAMGNIEEHSVDSIVKSSKFTQLRANMLSGVRSKECNRCYAQEDAGLQNQRLRHNAQWKNVTPDSVNKDGSIDRFDPVYVDIRLNNICNLKCRMCSGYFSSAIAQEEVVLFGSKESVQSSLKLQQRKMALKEIIEYVPTAEKIYFAGGEPLLTVEHYEILDALIACGNTDLEIVYNTNFTTLNYRGRSVLTLWKQFSNITIGASLDAEGAVAEYVRHGTNWNMIESNLELVKSQCPHVNFTVTSTVGLLNAASLIRLQQRWHNSGTLDISKFSQSVMVGPDHLTVCVLPLEHKQRLEHMINYHISWCKENNAKGLAEQWNDVLNYMWSRDDSHLIPEFKRLTQIMDQHRNESLSKSISELATLL
jgi:radical SAM protein with 4Fe4S-binding SPASM domain